MHHQIKEFLEIKCVNNVYQIRSLKKWRDKHQEYKDFLHEYFDENDLWRFDIRLDEYNQPLLLPVFCDLTEKETFLWLFNQINRILDFHLLENEYKIIMNEFYKIKISNNSIDKWFKKHNNYERFYKTDYLDKYLDYPNSYHLRLFILNPNSERLYVSRECFKNIIDFFDVMCNYENIE